MAEFCFRVRTKSQSNMLREILNSGASLSQVSRERGLLSFCVHKKEVARITNYLRSMGAEYEVHTQKGFFDNLLSPWRFGIAIGVVLIICAILGLSAFVWKIEVLGLEKTEIVEVLDFLEDREIKIGCQKEDIDCERLALELKEGLDFSAVSAKVEGVTLKVFAKEELSPPYYYDEVEKLALVAEEDGVITRIVKLQGECAVSQGESVKKGQILIHNYRTLGEEKIEVRAVGEVYAKVWRQKEVFIPKTAQGYEFTGESQKIYKITTKKDYDGTTSPYKYWSKEVSTVALSYFLPFFRHRVTYFERKPVEIINPDYLDSTGKGEELKKLLELEIQESGGEYLRSWREEREVEGGKILILTAEMEKRIEVYSIK